MLPAIAEGQNCYYIGMLDKPDDTIFVFGSNLQGIHGKGAALEALAYGAVRGIGVGLQGETYAIPTREFTHREIKTLSLDVIRSYVEDFVRLTQTSPGRRWLLTAIGTGYAGYKAHEIAPMFTGVVNCYIPAEWRQYL